jgi:antitoxin (DNA-binding transcriptional repressor) of toxin-antitoxin stability system
MYHMVKASVRDLRYRFSEVEYLLAKGEKVEITRHGQGIARLLPVWGTVGRSPDYLGRLRRVYGDKTLEVSGAEFSAHECDRF